MRKVIAAINMTLDGFCDHTVIVPDEEIHQHYTDLLRNTDTILYGRITYQLMEFWRTLVKDLSGEASMDDFAIAMDQIPKIVFSRTLENVEWESARLAALAPEAEVAALRQQAGSAILVGSRSLMIHLMNLNLVNEVQITVHPVLAGSGLPLFENVDSRMTLQLLKMKTFSGGAVTLYYEPETG